MKKWPSAHFLRCIEEKEKGGRSHEILSLFSISSLNQTGEVTYFSSISLFVISLFPKSPLPNTVK